MICYMCRTSHPSLICKIPFQPLLPITIKSRYFTVKVALKSMYAGVESGIKSQLNTCTSLI